VVKLGLGLAMVRVSNPRVSVRVSSRSYIEVRLIFDRTYMQEG